MSDGAYTLFAIIWFLYALTVVSGIREESKNEKGNPGNHTGKRAVPERLRHTRLGKHR
jgi:hypothetical protein